MQSENTAELAAALAKAQAAMKPATINKINPHFKNKYADLSAVIDAIRKPLADNGLSVTQTTEIRGDGLVLITTLRHATGQWLSSEYPLPVGAKPQELGSARTYARRYELSAILCIAADEDDDAEGANGHKASAPPPKPQPVQPPVNPSTGEVSPHAISAPDVMAWGSKLVAAVKASATEQEVNEWLAVNAGGIEALPEKIAKRVDANVQEKLASFGRAA